MATVSGATPATATAGDVALLGTLSLKCVGDEFSTPPLVLGEEGAGGGAPEDAVSVI